jgi:hypothetical protein
MRISRLTVDKLGVKLYDRVSAVLAELVANGYDADATQVTITAPMGQLLATKQGSVLADKGYAIYVTDDGHGMTPDEVNEFYLKVGAERRADPKRGDRSKHFHRKVMGRKGVGKLAPFGICEIIEVITSGGDLVQGKNAKGDAAQGYITAHLTLDRKDILTDTDADYNPTPGPLDGTITPKTGTTLILRRFAHRRVPEIAELDRQLAQRFGLITADWRIVLVDSTKPPSDASRQEIVGSFDVETMPHTKITFEVADEAQPDGTAAPRSIVVGPDGAMSDIEAGFSHEGRFYPITGWIAYAKDPYKDDLMAGVRIYCRGKIATQTNVFNRKAGFTGEHTIRSYLVGELHADWLDEEEDLIQTDRRDILWSHELGLQFEEWGRSLLPKIGTFARTPMRVHAWDVFRERMHLEQRIGEAFPQQDLQPVRDQADELARLMAQTIRQDELEDTDYCEALVSLALTLAPHVTLDQALRDVAESQDRPLDVITGILRTARVAELSSFGRIADDRVRVIQTVERLKDDQTTLESALQALIEEAPWLINPQWSPITMNQAFATLKSEFEKFYRDRTGEEIVLGEFGYSNKRADFVLANHDGIIEVVEIKRPGYAFQNTDMERLDRYVEMFLQFFSDPAHAEFKSAFRDFHVTLICDDIRLSGVHQTALAGLEESGRLTRINWRAFLLRTRRMHEDFLNEADRQRRLSARE